MRSAWKKCASVFSLVMWVVSCSTSQPMPADSVDVPVAPDPPKKEECIGQCYVDDEDQCVTTGSVVDGSVVEEESVICPSHCCDSYREIRSASRDPDGDGLIDEQDQCPEVAEDFDEFRDDDGCPDPDNDEDGILDSEDVCPLDAEDVDGFQDDDGCID